MGQYYQPPPPGYAAPPMEPPEAGSIKTMARIASIFGIIVCVIALLGAILELYWYAVWESYDYYWGYADDMVRTWYIIYAVILILMFIFGLIFFMQCNKISQMVDQRQYVQAKSKTLIWTIIGFLFVGVIPGILLLIAYLKFDTLIRSTQTQGYGPAPQPYAPAPPPPAYPPQQQYQQQGYRVCQGCGAQIPANSYACPNCGRQG